MLTNDATLLISNVLSRSREIAEGNVVLARAEPCLPLYEYIPA